VGNLFLINEECSNVQPDGGDERESDGGCGLRELRIIACVQGKSTGRVSDVM
jgi:hypothetical protein